MSDTKGALEAVALVSDQKQKIEQYKQILDRTIQSKDVEAAKGIVDHMLSDSVVLVVSRQVLQAFAHEIAKLPPDVHRPIASYALEKIAPRVVSFEEQVTLIRENLAELLEKEEDWSKAAQTLAGIDLDSGHRVVEPLYKLSKNIKIAMLYLEDDDPVNAELFIKKAASAIGSCRDESLELQYKTCYARILDSKRRFLEAATRYYELSTLGQRSIAGKTVPESELAHALQLATVCAILAAAGPQRSRLLSTLYKDERAPAMPLYPFLEKVYLERILSQDEVDSFSQSLKPHQLAVLGDGSTVLQRAVVQHNLRAASRLYLNIHVDQLAALLGVSGDRAEAIAADMMAEGRLQGSIDQVERLISFDYAVEPLLQWDAQIQGLCDKLNGLVDGLAKAAA